MSTLKAAFTATLLTLLTTLVQSQCGLEETFGGQVPNCSRGQCFCSGNSARCFGNGILDKLPPFETDIHHVYAKCYNFTVLTNETMKTVSSSVRSIHLEKNGLQNISADIFKRFSNLTSITFSGDSEANLSQLFEALSHIQKEFPLNVTLSYLQMTAENLTAYIGQLEKPSLDSITLSHNTIDSFNVDVFAGMKRLRSLILSGNWISQITGTKSLPTLEHLDLAQNRILMEGLQFCKANTTQTMFPSLKTMILKQNLIGSRRLNYSAWRCLDSVEELDLSNNTILALNVSLFSNLSSLKVLSLSRNWIQKLSPGKFPPELETINFDNNQFVAFPPLLCEDSSDDVFPNLKTLNFSKNYIKKIMIDKWRCLPNITVLDFSRNDVPRIENNTFSNFSSLKTLKLDNMITVVKNMEPMALCSESLEELSLRFDWIDFRQETPQQLFQCCPNVKKLDISYNYFLNLTEEKITEILSPLTKLEELKAQRINLEKFPSTFLTTFKYLKYLDINRNMLSTIQFPEYFNNKTWNLSIEHLSVAEGDINSITKESFPVSLLKALKNINLGRNEFACNCEMKWFKHQIHEGRIQRVELIDWPEEYICKSPTKEYKKPFKDYNPDDDCPLDPITVGIIAAATSAFVFLAISGTAYWNKWYIQYWLYNVSHGSSSRNKDIERSPLLGKYRYDAYVVYNQDDDGFVHHGFREFFETRLNYKLHIWKRDATNGWLVDVILDAMYQSRHVIVVVSNNLLKDTWCKFQVDVAIDKSTKLGRHYVLLVVLEDVDFRYVSKSWCVLLTKTPSANWSNAEEENELKRKVFELSVKKQLKAPLRDQASSLNGDVHEDLSDG